MIDSRVQSADFDAGRQLSRLAELGSPALASVIGLIERSDDVTEVAVEHYPMMAKAELLRIAEEASAQWRLAGLILIHRYGRIAPGQQLFFAGIAASEASEAQHACAYLVEAVRTRCPFWRQEKLVDGSTRWWGRVNGSRESSEARRPTA